MSRTDPSAAVVTDAPAIRAAAVMMLVVLALI
jgi:hypothetical protein